MYKDFSNAVQNKSEIQTKASFLLQGTFPTQGLEPRSPTLQADSVVAESQGSAVISFCSICLREKQLVILNLKPIHLAHCKMARGREKER